MTVSNEGVVHATINDVDIQMGAVTRNEQQGGYRADCSLCDFAALRSRRTLAATNLERHFHTMHATS